MQRCEAGEWWEARDAQMDGISSQARQSQRSPLVEGSGGTPAPTNQHDRERPRLFLRLSAPAQALPPKQVRRCPETSAFRNAPAACTSRFGVAPTRRA